MALADRHLQLPMGSSLVGEGQTLGSRHHREDSQPQPRDHPDQPAAAAQLLLPIANDRRPPRFPVGEPAKQGRPPPPLFPFAFSPAAARRSSAAACGPRLGLCSPSGSIVQALVEWACPTTRYATLARSGSCVGRGLRSGGQGRRHPAPHAAGVGASPRTRPRRSRRCSPTPACPCSFAPLIGLQARRARAMRSARRRRRQRAQGTGSFRIGERNVRATLACLPQHGYTVRPSRRPAARPPARSTRGLPPAWCSRPARTSSGSA